MEQERVIWTAEESSSMVSATLGRAMSTLLSARPKKLEDAISRLDSAAKRGSLVSLEESLRVLHSYIRDAAQRGESLDDLLVPMAEHSWKYKESKHSNQALILFNWLFQDEILFQAIATNLARIIWSKDDRFIALGWCILVRGLVEYEITLKLFTNNGIKEKYYSLLQTFSSCIPHLVSIVCKGSTLQEGFELPTRLSVAAADCILALTIAMTKKDQNSYGSDCRPTAAVSSGKKVKPTSKSPEVSKDMEMKFLLWDHLDELIILVQRLFAWSRKSRYLHAKGLERLLKWLQGTKGHHAHVQNEKAGSEILMTGVLLLSSCWKHYGMLIHLEDYQFVQHYKELLDQYLSGIQYYADNYAEEQNANKDSGAETTKFLLNCLSLLLGRLDGKLFEKAMTEDGLRISRILITLLHCDDEDVVDVAVGILKAVIFRTGNNPSDSREMDAVLPLLLHLLDERDGTARAVVVLIAECCFISKDDRCLQQVLKRLASADIIRRRNAIDVISELFSIAANPENINCGQDIANHLLKCLEDDEFVIRAQASNLITMMDPSLVLPALVGLIYSTDEVVEESASNTLLTLLKDHNKKFEVLCMLLDCLSNLCQNPDFPEASGVGWKGGSKLNAERVLELIPQWSESVKDWNLLVKLLVDKMFAEPSNAILVRFLSYISEHLADAADVVFHQLLLHERQQEWGSQNYETDGPETLEHSLFDRLCPLLIIRLLPLRVFDDLNCSLMYGELCNEDAGEFDINGAECVARVLLKRAFNELEFDDVRKLAAELCGRIHPQVLYPIIASQLEYSADAHDVKKIKACLFSICTSLVVRGKDSVLHPDVLKINKSIETVLSWPSLDGDEVSKAQHGCIDCLALMICAELQVPESFRDLTSKKPSLVDNCSGNAEMRNSVLSYVIRHLTHDRNVVVCFAKMGKEDCTYEESRSLSFRLCMANVLISACQKISDSGKKSFAQKVLPRLIKFVGLMESEIKAACVQVFFSAVYHLKSAILPYSSDLLNISLKSLKEGLEKEKLAGAKLMASLMASNEMVVGSIAEGLMEARSVLSSVHSSDTSPEVRQVSKQLLACLTSV